MATPKENALRLAALSGLGATGVGALWALLSDRASAGKPLEDLATMSPELVSIPHPSLKKKKKPEPLQLEYKEAEDKNFLMGDYARNVYEVPWVYPLGMGLTLAGLAAGHGVTSNKLKERRKKQMKKKEQKAEEAYNQALLSSYDPEKLQLHSKSAKLQEINEGLEKLASLMKISEDKPSFSEAVGTPYTGGPSMTQNISTVSAAVINSLLGKPGDKLKELGGVPAGGLLLAALGIPAAAGYASYRYWKDRDKTKLLNEAAGDRQIARLQENMPEPYVTIE